MLAAPESAAALAADADDIQTMTPPKTQDTSQMKQKIELKLSILNIIFKLAL